MAANLCDLSGGYFVGRPTNHAPDRTDEPAAAGSGGGLAYTGSETTAPIAVGAALLLLGAVLAVGARLRRRSRVAAAPADRG